MANPVVQPRAQYVPVGSLVVMPEGQQNVRPPGDCEVAMPFGHVFV